VTNPNLCVAASVCDPATGECGGGSIVGMSCSDDGACDPPDIVCRATTHSCVAGCTLAGACPIGLGCNPQTGRCCDPSAADCPIHEGPVNDCNTDLECAAPSQICSAGLCVPGCASSGCAVPLGCDQESGHCSTPLCVRDADCDPGSYCTQSGTCTVLAFGGRTPCVAGGKPVVYRCAVEESAAAFTDCAGAAGPSGCPYCLNASCLHPGLCTTIGDCHRGDACVAGLCRAQAPECPTTVPISAITGGAFAAGKELCVHDVVTAVRNGYDGMIEIKLGTSPYLFVDVAPMYKIAGVKIPTVGDAVTVHGTVRWDAGHSDWEVLPVDWLGP
jgi:hypothetical protein